MCGGGGDCITESHGGFMAQSKCGGCVKRRVESQQHSAPSGGDRDLQDSGGPTPRGPHRAAPFNSTAASSAADPPSSEACRAYHLRLGVVMRPSPSHGSRHMSQSCAFSYFRSILIYIYNI